MDITRFPKLKHEGLQVLKDEWCVCLLFALQQMVSSSSTIDFIVNLHLRRT